MVVVATLWVAGGRVTAQNVSLVPSHDLWGLQVAVTKGNASSYFERVSLGLGVWKFRALFLASFT